MGKLRPACLVQPVDAFNQPAISLELVLYTAMFRGGLRLLHLRSTSISREQFRDGLKTHLFTQAYALL